MLADGSNEPVGFYPIDRGKRKTDNASDGSPTRGRASLRAGQQWMPPGRWRVDSGCLMETKLASLSRRYQAALLRHLEQGPRASLRSADGLGREAVDLGLETLDLARIHEQALMALVLPSRSSGARDGMIKRAQAFFAEAVTPMEKTHRDGAGGQRPPESTEPRRCAGAPWIWPPPTGN